MICDKLYELAFAYRKTKVWEKIGDINLFALKLSDGKIGYIQIASIVGEGYDLNLFIGESGLRNYLKTRELDYGYGYCYDNSLILHDKELQRDYLQCSFVGKDELDEEELAEVRKYTRAHGIRIRGLNSYPQFSVFELNRFILYLEEKQQQYLCEALEAAIDFSQKLKEKSLQQLGFEAKDTEEELEIKSVPWMEREGLTYKYSVKKLTKLQKEEYPKPKAKNEISLARLKRIKKQGVWQGDIFHHLEPTQDSPEQVPHFEMLGILVNESTERVLPIKPIKDYEKNPEELLENLMEILLENKVCPKKIKVRDEKNAAFLEDLCAKLKILVTVVPEDDEYELEALNDAEESFYEYMTMGEEEEFQEMLETLMDISDEQLRQMPPELLEDLKETIRQGLVPDKVAKRIAKVFDLGDEWR